MLQGIAVKHDKFEKACQDMPKGCNGCKNTDNRCQYAIGQPTIPIRLHGQQHMKKRHCEK